VTTAIEVVFSSVGPAEQVAHRLPLEQRSPAPSLMLRPVVDHVTALAEGCEVGVGIVGGGVIPVGGGEDDVGPAGTAEDIGTGPDPDPAPPAIAPAAGLSIPPAAIAEVIDLLPVWPSAALAPTLCPAEADRLFDVG
jgi:hypothetical protein